MTEHEAPSSENAKSPPSPRGMRVLKGLGYLALGVGTCTLVGLGLLTVPSVQTRLVHWGIAHVKGLSLENFHSEGTRWTISGLKYHQEGLSLDIAHADLELGLELGMPWGISLTGHVKGLSLETQPTQEDTQPKASIPRLYLPMWVGLDVTLENIRASSPECSIALPQGHVLAKAKEAATVSVETQNLTLTLSSDKKANPKSKTPHTAFDWKTLEVPEWKTLYQALPSFSLPLPFESLAASLNALETHVEREGKSISLERIELLTHLKPHHIEALGKVECAENTLMLEANLDTHLHEKGSLSMVTRLANPEVFFTWMGSKPPLVLRPVTSELKGTLSPERSQFEWRGMEGVLPQEVSTMPALFDHERPMSAQAWRHAWRQRVPALAWQTWPSLTDGDTPLRVTLTLTPEEATLNGTWPRFVLPGLEVLPGHVLANYQEKNLHMQSTGAVSIMAPLTDHWSPTPNAYLGWQAEAAMTGSSITKLEASVKALTGTITAQGQWDFKTRSGLATVTLKGLRPYFGLKPGLERTNLVEGRLALEGKDHTLRHTIALTGKLFNAPLKMDSRGSFTETQDVRNTWIWEHDQAQLMLGGNTVRTSGLISPETLNVSLLVNAPDLSTLTLGQVPGLSGMVKGQASLTGSLHQPQWDTSLTIPHLGLKNQDEDPPKDELTIAGLTLTSSGNLLDWVKQDLATHTHLHVEHIDTPSLPMGPLDLTLAGTSRTHTVNLRASVPQSQITLNMLGHWWPSHLVYQANVESFQADNAVMPIRLEKPFEWAVLIQDEDVTVEPFTLLTDAGSLSLDKALRLHDWGRDGEASWRLNHFSLSGLNPWLPKGYEIDGVATGFFTGQWGSHLKGTGNLVLSPLRITLPAPATLTGSQTLSLDAIEGSLTADPTLLTTNWKLAAPWVDAQARLAIEQPQTEARVKGSFDVTRLELNTFNPWLEPNATMKGTLVAHLEPKGDKTHPQLYGTLDVNNLLLQNPDVTLPFKPSHIGLIFEGQESRLEGTLKTDKGDLTIAGHANWSHLEDPLVSVTLSSPPLPITLNQYGLVTVEPHLTAQATQKGINVTGTVNVPQARLSVASLPSQAITASDDVVMVNEHWEPLTPRSTTATFVPTFDINIVVGDDVKFNAFDLKASLSGQLRVASSALGMTGNGQLKISQGQFKAYGQDLLIEDGRITFSGPIDSPYVNIRAIRNPEETQDGVIAGIDVTGPASKPKLTLFSMPAMNQSNVLSYLLRGEGLGQGTGDDNLVTNALLGIGLSQTGELVQKIGQSIGLRDFHVNTRGAGENTQVVLSAQLLPHLEVKYGVGLFSALTDITLRYRLWHNFYIQAISSTQKELGLLYKFEF